MLQGAAQAGLTNNFSLPVKRESLFVERENQLEPQLPSSRISLYGQDPSLSGVRSSGLGRAGAPIVTQVGVLKRSYVLMCSTLSCKLCLTGNSWSLRLCLMGSKEKWKE